MAGPRILQPARYFLNQSLEVEVGISLTMAILQPRTSKEETMIYPISLKLQTRGLKFKHLLTRTQGLSQLSDAISSC